MIDIKGKIGEFWKKKKPEEKKKIITVVVIITILLIGIGMYKATRATAPQEKRGKDTKKTVSVDPKMLEKSMYNEATKELAAVQKEVKELKDKVDKKDDVLPQPDNKIVGTEVKKAEVNINGRGQLPPPVVTGTCAVGKCGTGIPSQPVLPPPPGMMPQPQQGSIPPGSYNVPLPPGAPLSSPAKETKSEIFGEIEMVSQRMDSDKDKKDDKDKKKDSMKVYLPPSFMEATLLSGLDAPTTETAKGQPVPVLLRIKAPAVLPNKVKATLTGCFVVGEGHGNLADERAHLRLTTLSCLSKKGQSVIDAKIKGFVTDTDGKIGLRGNVVSKMGANLARSLLAGFVSGFGTAVRANNTTTSVSPLGATQVIDTDKAVKVGLGEGIFQATRDLQKFYLDLGKSAMPVVEVGASKSITLVIMEGTYLEIRKNENNCLGGGELCEKY